eukprot:sb/3472658/
MNNPIKDNRYIYFLNSWKLEYCVLYLLREILNFQESQVKSFETHFNNKLSWYLTSSTDSLVDNALFRSQLPCPIFKTPVIKVGTSLFLSATPLALVSQFHFRQSQCSDEIIIGSGQCSDSALKDLRKHYWMFTKITIIIRARRERFFCSSRSSGCYRDVTRF